MIKKKHMKTQGEIFGIALLFVVIIIGIIVYSQYRALSNVSNENSQQNEEYKILAEGTLNTILKMSTGCKVEAKVDSVEKLIDYCLENDNFYSDIDPQIECSGITKNACAYSLYLLNTTLLHFFNDSSTAITNTPYKLVITIPANSNTFLSNKNISNLGSYNYKDTIINDTNLWDYGYKKAPSGEVSWATSERDIHFEFFLYYR